MVVTSYLVHCNALLQNVTDIVTKCGNYFIKKMPQKFITKCVSFFHYKMQRLLQNTSVVIIGNL